MKSGEISESLTQNSTALKPIYEKVKQLKRIKQNKKVDKAQIQIVTYIEPAHNKQFQMPVDRRQQFIRRRLEVRTTNNQQTYKIVHSPNKRVQLAQIANNNDLKLKTKSQKILHFLKINQSKTKKPQTSAFIQNSTGEHFNQRQTFTPMRPISRISYAPQSVAGTQITRRSGSHRSSAGNSQAIRLSQSSANTNTQSKYLRKGHRMRQTLLKQLQTPEDIQQQKQLVYLKQYDQWVPASLASYKKLELEHFMNILLGGKKIQKKQSIIFQPVYL